jgi:alkylated DNA repair protein alkB family protein 1
VTIGYRYNWTTKDYDFDNNHLPIPAELAEFCSSFARSLGYKNYKSEAGIVNFYQPEDTLTCHVDRSEMNMTPPLISLSFGLDCIFLLGGETREDEVYAIRVHSGDISVLAGKSRSFFHGVPRVLKGTNPIYTDDPDLDDFITTTRINLNIRQVF